MIYSETDSLSTMRIVFSLIVTFFLSVGITLYSEAYGKSRWMWLSQGLAILYGGVFYFFFNPWESWFYESMVVFALHGVGFFSFLFFAPYSREMVGKGENMIEYTNYFTRVAWTFLMASIIGIALLALGMIALTATIELFDLSQHIDTGKWYGYWAVLALVFFAPLYGLVEFPYHTDIDTRSYDVNRFFSFLIRYIALPFIIIYFIILYAYSVRVLLNFGDWPKGQISWMVIGFSIFGYLVHIFSKPYEAENDSIRLWRKYFPMLVVPQIFMLAYAIWLRIMQYDLTMNRYFVVIFWIWLLGISLYYIFARRKSLIVIPASLTLITLVISVGPWSVYSVPLSRQYDRLMANFEKAGMRENGKIIPAKDTLEKTLNNDIYSGIEYVCQFSECEKIRELFPEYTAEIEAKSRKEWERYMTESTRPYQGASVWEIVQGITEKLNIDPIYGYSETVQPYFTYWLDYKRETSIFPMNIDGFTTIAQIYGNFDPSVENTVKNAYAQINPDDATMTVHIQSGTLWPISLAAFNTDLINQYGTGGNYSVKVADFTRDFETPEAFIRIFLEQYSIKNPNYREKQDYKTYSPITGYILIRKK